MAFIAVSSWIPRSYTHVYEIGGKLEGVKLPISDVKIDGSLFFTVKTKGGREVKVSLKPYGLFTFTSEFEDSSLDEKTVSSFKDEIRGLLVEDIFGAIQHVTCKQIQEGILPIAFHAAVFSAGFQPNGLDEVDAGGLKVFVNRQMLYSSESDVYVSGDSRQDHSTVTDYFSYVILTSSYVNSMVEVMSQIYKRIVETKKIVEKDDFSVMKDVMISLSGIRKECSERYGKIIQAVSNFDHARNSFERDDKGFSKDQSRLSNALEINEGFERLNYDSDYLLPLWSDVLIKNLDNLSSLIDIRMELQESVETRKEQKEMKLLQAIFLVGVITSIITLGAMPGATLTMYSPDGLLLAKGTLVSFELRTLLEFGVIAVLIALFFFTVFNYLYARISKLLFK